MTARDDIYGPRTNLPPDAWHLEGSEVHLASPAIPRKNYMKLFMNLEIRPVDRAIGFGISQSAMVLRALLFEGFNADERGRQVFDGIFAHVAGTRRATFQRFRQASRTAGPLQNAWLSTTEQGPYVDVDLLKRAQAQQDKAFRNLLYKLHLRILGLGCFIAPYVGRW